VFYSTLNHLKNNKVRSFESERGAKRRKKEKNMFCGLKSLFFFFLFFITAPFHLHFKDDF